MSRIFFEDFKSESNARVHPTPRHSVVEDIKNEKLIIALYYIYIMLLWYECDATRVIIYWSYHFGVRCSVTYTFGYIVYKISLHIWWSGRFCIHLYINIPTTRRDGARQMGCSKSFTHSRTLYILKKLMSQKTVYN